MTRVARLRWPAALAVALLAGLVLGCVPALAANYLMLYSGADSALLVDRASIRRHSDPASAWTLQRFGTLVEASAGVPGHRAVRTRYLLNCRERRLAAAEHIYYADPAARRTVKRQVVADPHFDRPVTQGQRMLLEVVCAP